MFKPQKQVSDERYNIITSRYLKFQETMGDPRSEPVKVFDSLFQKSLDELELIREVSQDLQKKKDEDVRKAALAAADIKEEIKEVANPVEKEDS